jgi:hypothetical protein
MQPESLMRDLEAFLAEAPSAVVFEDGEPIFDLSLARYSVSADHGKCLLHLWSDERNTVRRVLDVEVKKRRASAFRAALRPGEALAAGDFTSR